MFNAQERFVYLIGLYMEMNSIFSTRTLSSFIPIIVSTATAMLQYNIIYYIIIFYAPVFETRIL